jgi:hypothetical protein
MESLADKVANNGLQDREANSREANNREPSPPPQRADDLSECRFTLGRESKQ